MDNPRYFEYELTALEDIPQGETVKFYTSPYGDETLYVRKLVRSFLEERNAYIGTAVLDITKGQKCYAVFKGGCEVGPIVSTDVSPGLAIGRG